MEKKPITLSKDNAAEILSKYDTLLLDCDGVVWETDFVTPIEGVNVAIERLRGLGKKVLFVTNGSRQAREGFVTKFKNLVKFDAHEEDIFGVAYAAAVYLKDMLKMKGKCYLVGSKGMARELDEAGIPYIGVGPDHDEVSDDANQLREMSKTFDQDIGAVLVGYDPHFNYAKLFKAASYLTKPECAYICTTLEDTSVRIGPMCCQPVTGSLVPSISAASKRQPFVIGKPDTHFMECIRTKFPNIDLKRTLMVGDSMKTDVPFAHNCGIDSLLVLTGGSTEQDVENATDKNSIPTYVLSSLGDLGHML